MNLSDAGWRKSSYSQGGGTECVEVARMTGHCAVRDSKNSEGPILALTRDEWATLLSAIKAGAHDRR